MIDLKNITFDHCLKCTVCTIYCPVARVSPEFPGPKQSGPDAERLRIKDPGLLDDSLRFCTNCKRCEIACPSDVRIADIIQTAKWKYAGRTFRPRDFLLGRTDLLGRPAVRASRLVNALAGFKPARILADKLFRIPVDRPLPRYDRGTFERWFSDHASSQDGFERKAVYFHGCYVNYNDHALGRDVVRLLNALGFGVTLTREVCCGVPLMAGGYIDRARKNARHNIGVLTRASGEAARIVSASSTCSFALKNEYPNLLGLDNSAIAGRIEYITRFVHRCFEEGPVPRLGPLDLTVAYHAPCHLERMGGALYTIELLKRIPGLNLKLLHSECCGIAGTYGFKSEFHPVAQEVGRDLFRRIEAIRPDVVITDCETCKWQIELNTSRPVLHPVTLLCQSLDV